MRLCGPACCCDKRPQRNNKKRWSWNYPGTADQKSNVPEQPARNGVVFLFALQPVGYFSFLRRGPLLARLAHPASFQFQGKFGMHIGK